MESYHYKIIYFRCSLWDISYRVILHKHSDQLQKYLYYVAVTSQGSDWQKTAVYKLETINTVPE
jgi:hypothetical protein